MTSVELNSRSLKYQNYIYNIYIYNNDDIKIASTVAKI